jgi:hypothetical protein
MRQHIIDTEQDVCCPRWLFVVFRQAIHVGQGTPEDENQAGLSVDHSSLVVR